MELGTQNESVSLTKFLRLCATHSLFNDEFQLRMIQNTELYDTAKLNEKNKLRMRTVVACFQVMPQNLYG